MTTPAGAHLDVRTLGGLDVQAGGAPVRVPTKKVLLLLAAVAASPGMSLSRERLKALLWSNRGEEQGRGSLRHALAALRKALADPAVRPDPPMLATPSPVTALLTTTADHVALDAGHTFCDAAAFASAEPGDSESAAFTAALYTGPFLDGVDAPDPAFEAWMMAERRSLHAKALVLVDAFDPSPAAPGARQAIADLARRLLAENPACEEAYRALIRRDLAEGRRNAAIRRFEDCRDAVRTALGVDPEEMTLQLIVTAPVAAAAPVANAATAAASDAPAGENIQVDRPSIVVLPFKNLSNDPEQGFFADGVVEEITSALSRIRDFFVIARQSAETLRDSTQEVREIGRAFGVRYVLEGAVRRAGGRVRITVSLIDAESAAQLWTDRYDGNAGDVFDFQDEIAASVAGALHPSLRQAEIDRARRKRPENLKAYDLVLRAYPHFWAHTKADNRIAIDMFGRVLKIEPGKRLAGAMLAWCHAQDTAYLWTDDPDAAHDLAIDLANRAIELTDDDPSTLVAAGAALTICARDFDTAETLIGRSLAIDPNHAWGWMRLGWLRHYRAESDTAISAFEQALRLSPFDPFAFNILIGQGVAHQTRGDHARAVELVEAGLHARPAMHWGYRALATTAATAGNLDKAHAAMGRFLAAYPDTTIESMMRVMPHALVSEHAAYWEGLRLAGLPEN